MWPEFKMTRTASTNHASSLKPVSSTLGITAQANTFEANSSAGQASNMSKSDLYSNCISQLQSTHNAMREAQNLANFTGSLSPASTTIAPILVRSSKLNQSQSSVHSSTNGIVHHPKQVMTTFGSPSVTVSTTGSSVPAPASPLVVNDFKKGLSFCIF